MTDIVYFVFYLMQLLLIIHLLLPMLVLILNLIIGDRKLSQIVSSKKEKADYSFAAIVTAHQDSRFIPPIIDSFLRQTYDNFVLYIVADDCDLNNIESTDSRVVMLKPDSPLHAKTKSIKYAIENFIQPHDVLVVFDSDNLVHPNYLKNLNKYFEFGYKAVQTHMLSKNIDTRFAKLDSIGHIYNNFVERKGRMNLGLSSGILGLGIAIDSNVYKSVMYNDGLGGFDKKLQAYLVENVHPIGFANDAIVYDEKIEDSYAFERQRTRWMHTYFKYFNLYLKLFFKGIKKGSFDIIFFAFNALRPPLLVTLMLALLFLTYWVVVWNPVVAMAWLLALMIFSLTYTSIIIIYSQQKGITNALRFIPLAVFSQLKSLLNIRQARKSFLKTEHSKVTYITDLLENGES